jgi:hypothetical protein
MNSIVYFSNNQCFAEKYCLDSIPLFQNKFIKNNYKVLPLMLCIWSLVNPYAGLNYNGSQPSYFNTLFLTVVKHITQ